MNESINVNEKSDQTELPSVDPKVALIPANEEEAATVGLPSAAALSHLKKFAKEVAGTPFFPRGLGENPATILAVVLAGREMDMKPMEAIGSFYLSPGGRLGLYAEAMLARLQRKGFQVKITKREKWDGAIRVLPPNSAETDWSDWTFSEADARTAGLLPADLKSNWNKYPRNMPIWRCVSDAYRFYRGQLGDSGGISLSAEEVMDIETDQAQAAAAETRNKPYTDEFYVGRKDPAAPASTEARLTPEVIVETIPETPPAKPRSSEQEELRAGLEGASAEFIRLMGVPEKLGQDYIKEFLLAYLGVTSKPRDLTRWLPAFEALRAIMADDERRAAFLQNRTLTARQAAGRGGDLEAFLIGKCKFPEITVGLARQVMEAYNYGGDESKFIEWAKAVGIDAMDTAEALAFLPVAVATNKAIRIADLAARYQLPLVRVIDKIQENCGYRRGMAWNWVDVGAGEIQKQIDSMEKMLAVPGKEAAPAPPKAEEAASGSLFD